MGVVTDTVLILIAGLADLLPASVSPTSVNLDEVPTWVPVVAAIGAGLFVIGLLKKLLKLAVLAGLVAVGFGAYWFTQSG